MKDLIQVVPMLLQRLALDRKDRDAAAAIAAAA